MTDAERILVVDDEEAIRSLMARLLGGQGYSCITAADVAEARRALSETSIALMLTDVNMPGESGFDLAHEVNLDYPDTAVVLVTASTTGASPRPRSPRCVRLRVKPFKANELLSTSRTPCAAARSSSRTGSTATGSS